MAAPTCVLLQLYEAMPNQTTACPFFRPNYAGIQALFILYQHHQIIAKNGGWALGSGAGSEKSRTNLHSVEKGGVQIIKPRSAFRAVIANLRPLTEKEKLNCIAGVVNLRKVFIYTLKEAADFFEHFLSFKQFFPNINSLKKHITM